MGGSHGVVGTARMCGIFIMYQVSCCQAARYLCTEVIFSNSNTSIEQFYYSPISGAVIPMYIYGFNGTWQSRQAGQAGHQSTNIFIYF